MVRADLYIREMWFCDVKLEICDLLWFCARTLMPLQWAEAIESLDYDSRSDKSFGMKQRPDGDIEIDEKFWEEEFHIPNCERCNGVLKPDVSIFPLPVIWLLRLMICVFSWVYEKKLLTTELVFATHYLCGITWKYIYTLEYHSPNCFIAWISFCRHP